MLGNDTQFLAAFLFSVAYFLMHTYSPLDIAQVSSHSHQTNSEFVSLIDCIWFYYCTFKNLIQMEKKSKIFFYLVN